MTSDKMSGLSNVEKIYLKNSSRELLYSPIEKIGIIQVKNFPELGQLAALRFLEWVLENPGGIISLPTGKTPEHFIKWVTYYLDNWNKKEINEYLTEFGINTSSKPDMHSLHFVQIDEFYPIDSSQHNSFYYYIKRFYFQNFGLDISKALLINVNEIPTAEKLSINEIFPDKYVDLTLRYRYAKTRKEQRQKETIKLVDEFCTNYERKIRELGGIGFFLGGIGPDGHIGFNIEGSDHFSTSRLTETNYETQAAASTDLGGIEIARNRLVITIGLNTITYNKDATAIIIASGEAKANIIRDSIESVKNNKYPATVLQKLSRARFYLTDGAALRLRERRLRDIKKEDPLSKFSIERAIINLAVEKRKEVLKLDNNDYQSNELAKYILQKTGLSAEKINKEIRDAVLERFKHGISSIKDQRILHTGPHHDDIMLGYLPYILHLVRDASNMHHFTVLTSGFTAVTNSYMMEIIENLNRHFSSLDFIARLKTKYFDTIFEEGKNRDVNLYLDGVAAKNNILKNEAQARRTLRNIIEIYGNADYTFLTNIIDELINYFHTQYPGKKDTPEVQKLKGMLREWEEEILWAHLGFNTNEVSHLRLGFYQGEIFTENPELNRDVLPVLNLLRKFKPTIVTVALDPEGSGPDTHYKVLQSITEALRLYGNETDISNLRIWGYRNVWYRFHPAEANIYIPVSLNSFALMDSMFMNSYGSQKRASFPSWEYDGPFSELSQKLLAEQYHTIRLCLGRDFFIKHEIPRVRGTHGMVYLQELTLNEFYTKSIELKKLTENRNFIQLKKDEK
jgi:glucosamine-6-phosphate deaminase